jgi:hypothetical protein
MTTYEQGDILLVPLLASIDASLVRRRLGALSPDDLATVRQLFRTILDLA